MLMEAFFYFKTKPFSIKYMFNILSVLYSNISNLYPILFIQNMLSANVKILPILHTSNWRKKIRKILHLTKYHQITYLKICKFLFMCGFAYYNMTTVTVPQEEDYSHTKRHYDALQLFCLVFYLSLFCGYVYSRI